MMCDRSLGGQNLGIGFSYGPLWQKTRTWTFNHLKNLGFGKTLAMEHFVREETEELFKRIDSSPSKIMESENLLGVHLLGIAYQFITCQSLTTEDRERIRIMKEKNHVYATSGLLGIGFANAFPFVRHLLPGITGKTVSTDNFKSMCIVGRVI